MKKAQILSLPFMVIFAILLFILILVFSFFYMQDYVKQAERAQIINFITDLKKDVQEYKSLETGSQKNISIKLPQKIQKVCFLNYTDLDLNYNLFFTPPIDNYSIPSNYYIPNLITSQTDSLCILNKKQAVLTTLYNNVSISLFGDTIPSQEIIHVEKEILPQQFNYTTICRALERYNENWYTYKDESLNFTNSISEICSTYLENQNITFPIFNITPKYTHYIYWNFNTLFTYFDSENNILCTPSILTISNLSYKDSNIAQSTSSGKFIAKKGQTYFFTLGNCLNPNVNYSCPLNITHKVRISHQMPSTLTTSIMDQGSSIVTLEDGNKFIAYFNSVPISKKQQPSDISCQIITDNPYISAWTTNNKIYAKISEKEIENQSSYIEFTLSSTPCRRERFPLDINTFIPDFNQIIYYNTKIPNNIPYSTEPPEFNLTGPNINLYIEGSFLPESDIIISLSFLALQGEEYTISVACGASADIKYQTYLKPEYLENVE